MQFYTANEFATVNVLQYKVYIPPPRSQDYFENIFIIFIFQLIS